MDNFVSEQTKMLWKIELDMAELLLQLCKQYNLKIWAGWGTLLGAARHKGFIPWDDDMDFMMMRQDYDILMNLTKEDNILPNPYSFDTSQVTCIKIRKDDTSMLLSKYRLNKNVNQGVWIDIFCLDKAPDNLNDYLSDYQKIKLSIRIARHNNLNSFARRSTFKFRFGHLCTKLYFLVKNIDLYIDRINSSLRELSENQSEDKLWAFMIFCTDGDIQKIKIYEASCFSETVLLPFENTFLPCPAGWDKLLTSMYGNWQIPVKGASVHGEAEIDTCRSYKEVVEEKLKQKPWWKRFWYKY